MTRTTSETMRTGIVQRSNDLQSETEMILESCENKETGKKSH